MATLESIQTRIAKLQAQAEALVEKKTTEVLERIRGLMEKHGITTADIEAHVGGKQSGRRAGIKAAAKPTIPAAKYRNSKTGATWTGHGRAPGWIANAKDRSKFLIDGVSPKVTSAAKKSAMDGSPLQGSLPPLYRDPKTGATWSGRGRAPAWLAGAKDRSNFLIAKADVIAAEPKAKAVNRRAAAEKVSGKKVAAQKVAAKKSPPVVKKATAKKHVAKKARARKVAAKNAVGTVEPVQAAVATTIPTTA
ncbi:MULTISPECIES: H-NS family nucleoid-associated regulatory protein [Burkholderia]|uniref:H-NS family nucleoid-associated regulatory protein n=1 Tax=Burkholderia TaxID=32008 RepID=UPI0009E2E86E|nr:MULTISPECIES: H-NS family nucleoid-associated regulatory protein [Burkholderia]MCA7942770.1 H-NS histone family protein [Burkholderia vietnamiensis]MCA8452221.1 H-NS histone family protein [Burkholderia vietnamiensis]HDR8956015.1 H-NS histone family protein [Burkholderia vietnamiensis]HDR8973333.1 H-NS histone family protein [Burkholderia vietnamiensis]HDR9222133.1 H-NS histone family protein [Burkholderia vietnamiensis]